MEQETNSASSLAYPSTSNRPVSAGSISGGSQLIDPSIKSQPTRKSFQIQEVENGFTVVSYSPFYKTFVAADLESLKDILEKEVNS